MAGLLLMFYVRWWPFELIVSYTPQILAVVSVLLLWLLFAHIRRGMRQGWRIWIGAIGRLDGFVMVVLAGLTVYVFAVSLIGLSSQASADTFTDSMQLTVTTLNNNFHNEIAASSKHIETINPDVVVLQEITPSKVRSVAKAQGFNFHYTSDCNCGPGNTEAGMLSRYPLRETEIIHQRQGGIIIRTKLTVQGIGEIALYGAHLSPPITPGAFQARGAAFAQLRRQANKEHLPVVIAGDFNTTVFSPDMRRFLKSTKDRLNLVAQRNWPRCSWFGLGHGLCSRIDHIIAPSDWAVEKHYIGKDVGSDHRPVTAVFAVPSR